jgi:hypothetical protein
VNVRDEMITVEYAGPASRQVGTLPWYEVRAWWTVRDGGTTVRDGGTTGRVKLAAGRELKRHVQADHVECVNVDMDTYNSPRINAMITFRVLTHEQFEHRAELRKRVYTRCDGDGCANEPGQLVEFFADRRHAALCYGCWHPLSVGESGAVKVLHWINRHGKLSNV